MVRVYMLVVPTVLAVSRLLTAVHALIFAAMVYYCWKTLTVKPLQHSMQPQKTLPSHQLEGCARLHNQIDEPLPYSSIPSV